MEKGELYDAAIPELIEQLLSTRDKIFELNHLRPSQLEEREKLIREIIGTTPEKFIIISPFFCDYGHNIHLGKNFFAYCCKGFSLFDTNFLHKIFHNKHISLYIVYSTFIEFITISLQNFTFRLLILIKIFLQFFGIFIGYVSYYFLGQNIMHKCYCYCMRSVSRMQFHKHCLKGLFNCGF